MENVIPFMMTFDLWNIIILFKTTEGKCLFTLFEGNII